MKIFRGRLVTAATEKFLLPNGRIAWLDKVYHPGGVCILPRFENGDILLLRQYRHAAGKYPWEIPAGTLERNEKPLSCAKRELREETGYQARCWKKLVSFYTAPGFCDEVLHLFLASHLKEGKADQESYEVIRSYRLPVSKLKQMILQGKIDDSKTLVAVTAYLAKERRWRSL